MKRMIVTISVPDDTDKHDLALEIAAALDDADPTVWELAEFFQDVDDGVVCRHRDRTTSESDWEGCPRDDKEET